MALFKIFRGSSVDFVTDLSEATVTPPFQDGFCYFLTDSKLFYIDCKVGDKNYRVPLNADEAKTLQGYIVEDDVLTDDNIKIPTSPVVYKAIEDVYTNIRLEIIQKANKTEGVYYIEGSGLTIGSTASWTGSHNDITEYYNGLKIAYKIGIAGLTTTTLNINNLGAVPVVRNASTPISNAYAVNSIIMLTYTTDSSTAYWKIAEYNTDTKNTVGNQNKLQNDDTELYLIGALEFSNSESSSVVSYTNSNVFIKNNKLNSAQGFVGDLEGYANKAGEAVTANIAAQANQDANGNIIHETYDTSVSVNSKIENSLKPISETLGGILLLIEELEKEIANLEARIINLEEQVGFSANENDMDFKEVEGGTE